MPGPDNTAVERACSACPIGSDVFEQIKRFALLARALQ
jgi:hypothetical protein